MSKAQQYKSVILERLKQGANLAQIADALRESPHALYHYLEQYKNEGLIEGDARTLEGYVVDDVEVATRPGLADKRCGFQNCDEPIYRTSFGHAASRYCAEHQRCFQERRAELEKETEGKFAYSYAEFEQEAAADPDTLPSMVSVDGRHIRLSRVMRNMLEKLYYVRLSDVQSLGTSTATLLKLVKVGCTEKADGKDYAITPLGIAAAEALWGTAPEQQEIEMNVSERTPASNNGNSRGSVQGIDPPAPPAQAESDFADSVQQRDPLDREATIDVHLKGLEMHIRYDPKVLRAAAFDVHGYLKLIAEQIMLVARTCDKR